MSSSAEELVDRSAVSDVVYAYATALDTRDWDLFAQCLADPIYIDYSTFDPSLDLQMPRGDWVERVRLGLSGFDVTQHISSNHRHKIAGDRAQCVSYMQASHFLKNGEGFETCTLFGYYTNDLERSGADWRIAKCALTITAHDGDMGVFARAAERFAASGG
ncbi:MAG: nuclear transport factor 2 family protein [Pseudomonadota bacterium]